MSATKIKNSPLAADPTQNVNIVSIRSIIAPGQLQRLIPSTEVARQTVLTGRQDIRRVLRGDDKRLLIVIGPCSVHDVQAAGEYARRLAGVQQQVKDKFLIVMRVYFEKPRTIVGWKGLINDPHIDGSFDMDFGLKQARELMLTINELNLPCGTEFLDPIIPQYLDDLVSWAAIGARTTESQTHRQMASGLSMPVGYKNSTDGSVQIAIDALKAARSGHHFLGIDEAGLTCIVQTRGNPDGHIILRGGSDQTNFDPKNVAKSAAKLAAAQLSSRLMVDCSHANSSKRHENQRMVWQSVIEQRANPDCPIMGVMIESNLIEGQQVIPADPRELKYGVSITDACIGWETTEQMLLEGARRL